MTPNALMNFALGMLSRNPRVASNPQAQAMIQILQSGDAKRGEEIANNICQSYGITPQQAVTQASTFFNLPR